MAAPTTSNAAAHVGPPARNYQQCDRRQRQRRIDCKDPLPAEVLGQPAAQHRTAGCGERRRRRPYADGTITLFLRINRTDQSQTRRRDDRGGNALHDTKANQPLHRRRDHAGRRRKPEAKASDTQHARLAVVIGERAADQRQRRQRQHVAVQHPLNRGKVRSEKRAQLGQRDGQRRTVNEGHRRSEHAGGEHHAAALRRDLAPERARARLGVDDAAVAWLHEGLRHGELSSHFLAAARKDSAAQLMHRPH